MGNRIRSDVAEWGIQCSADVSALGRSMRRRVRMRMSSLFATGEPLQGALARPWSASATHGSHTPFAPALCLDRLGVERCKRYHKTPMTRGVLHSRWWVEDATGCDTPR